MTVLPLALLISVFAQVPAAPRYERPIAVAAPGPQRLAVDATLLAGAAPFTVVRRGNQRVVAEGGLSDLRLIGADGREVPYLLVYPPIPDPQWLRGAIQPIATTEKTSGFEADIGRIQDVNGIDVRLPVASFMKRFMLEASGDRRHWTLVIPEGTLFDLPDRRVRQTMAGFAAGSYRYLRVTWDDTHSGRVPRPADVFVRLAAAAAAPAPTTVPLRFERRPSEPGRSRYHVRLPGSRLPIVALLLDAGGTYVFRSVSVTEPRLAAWQAAPVTIGEGPLVRDQSSSGMALRVPLQQPSQAELDLLVEDGDNPPLELRGIAAEFAELPWIYVEAPGPLVARYGDVSLPRPSYDLEAARATVRIDALPEARWESAPRPAVAALAPIDAAALSGAQLDTAPFRYSREIAGGDPGLVALPLDAAVLAHSAGPASQFADVRIVERTGRQVPRLVERRAEPLVIPLRAEPAAPTAAELQERPGLHRSVYHIALPYAVLPEARVVIGTTAAVFRRHVTIGVERPPDRAHRDPWFLTIGAVEWFRSEASPAALTLPLNREMADATPLTLVVDEGDNSALPIAGVQLLLPSYRLRFVRPASTARLVYGNAAVETPRYDLALLAPAVLSAPVTDVSMSAEAETKAAAVEQLISPRMFWAILVAAVVALLGVLVALLR